MLLFDSHVHSVSLIANRSFYRKVTADRLAALAGVNPHTLYGFQEDSALGAAVTNEGSSGAPGDMALSSPLMWNGNGWYRNFGSIHQAGNKGFGLIGTGGASTAVGTISSHPGTDANAKTKYTWIYKFIMDGTGGGGGGRLSEASASHICFASGANTLATSIYDGGAWASNTTGANVVYDYWHDLVVVFDGTQVGDVNRLRMILDGRDVTVNVAPGIPAAMVDAGVPTYVLNGRVGGVFNRAWDGELGLVATLPGVALSLAEAQSLIEVSGGFMPTVANQTPIVMSGIPKYSFAWANSRHFRSYQSYPFLTARGSMLAWLNPSDFVNEGAVMGVCQTGVNGDYLTMETRGDIALDPIELMGGSGGVTDLRLQYPFGVVNGYGQHFLAFTSDGATVRAYLDGVAQTLAVPLGANTGQWFATYPLSTAFVIGALPQAALGQGLGAEAAKFLVYDREIPQIEIQQIEARRFALAGPRWYPSS